MTRLPLFIHHLITGDLENLKWWAISVGIMAAMVVLASAIDLFYGVKASKAAGIYQTSSYGLRKTVEKDVSYLLLMVFGVMIDGCLSFVVTFPAATAVIVVSEIIIEAMSVNENRKRARMGGTDPLDVARAVIKTFGISEAGKIEEVIKYINDKKEEKPE